MEHLTVHGPGDVQGEPVRHADEYSEFIADCYAVDVDGRRLYDSAFLSRPKGCDKSGLASRVAQFEALGPCRFLGWARGGEVYRDPWGLGFRYVYTKGEPMGRPVKVPYVRLMATEETQTGNVYDSVHFNLTHGPLAKALPHRDMAGLTRIVLPGGGEITPSTASSASKDGGKETFVDFDESHIYVTPELRRMYRTVTRNLRKRKKIAETWFLESTTMFAAGQESIAEETYKLAEAIREGRSRRSRLLFDHRWGDLEDPSDEAALRAALRESYGDALAWVDLDGLVDEFFDTRARIEDSRRYFLNAPTSTEDAWVSFAEWQAVSDASRSLADRDTVTLGFDGSVRDDSTALVACRVSDGHLELLGCWEKPSDRGADDDWQVDREAVDAAVSAAFGRFEVAGMYCDPALWQDYVDRWTGEFGGGLQVKAAQGRPLEWWTNRPTAMVAALERFHSAILNKDLSHDGGSTLTRHVLNARRRVGRSGITISKPHPKSDRKIDAAMAATLAYECRSDAVAAGVGQASTDFALGRIR